MTMTTATLIRRAHDGAVADDPAAKPVRRRFTAAYKLAILDEYEQLADPGTKGALLRREGLYSSHIVEWRRARDGGALAGLERPRGRPAADPRDAQIARLQKEK